PEHVKGGRPRPAEGPFSAWLGRTSVVTGHALLRCSRGRRSAVLAEVSWRRQLAQRLKRGLFGRSRTRDAAVVRSPDRSCPPEHGGKRERGNDDADLAPPE